MHSALAWDDWGGHGRFTLFTLWISVCIDQGVMSTMYVFCTNSLLGICWCLNACLLLVSWRSKCRIQNSEYPQMTYLIYCRSWLLAQSQLATTERHRPLYITKAQECFLLQPPLAFLSLFFPGRWQQLEESSHLLHLIHKRRSVSELQTESLHWPSPWYHGNAWQQATWPSTELPKPMPNRLDDVRCVKLEVWLPRWSPGGHGVGGILRPTDGTWREWRVWRPQDFRWQSLLTAKLEEFYSVSWWHRLASVGHIGVHGMMIASRREDLVRKIRLEDVPEFIKLQDSIAVENDYWLATADPDQDEFVVEHHKFTQKLYGKARDFMAVSYESKANCEERAPNSWHQLA